MRRRMAMFAVALWAAAGVVSVAGWTSSLSALSFTTAPGEPFALAMTKSVVVLISWFGAVMVAPVVILTAMAWSVFEHLKALP